MTQFDKNNLNTLRKDIAEALKQVEAKHNIAFKLGNIRFSSKQMKLALESFVVGDATDGAPANADKASFEANAHKVGLKKEDWGKQLNIGGERMTLVGIKPANHRMPFIVENAKGKRYKVRAEQLRMAGVAVFGNANPNMDWDLKQ